MSSKLRSRDEVPFEIISHPVAIDWRKTELRQVMLAPEMQSNPDLCFLKSTQGTQCVPSPGTTAAQGPGQ